MNKKAAITVRQVLAEALGTFALTFTAAATASMSPPELDGYARQATSTGLVVLASIYALSDISGAHINPAVTLAFALRRAFPWSRLLLYWPAQLAGAVVASALATLVSRQPVAHALTRCHVHPLRGLLAEAVATFFLITVILHTSKRNATVGPQAAIAVGATIVLSTLWAGPLTGASMNPARSFGPAIVACDFGHAWIYAVGPILGASLAVALTFALRGSVTAEEEKTAEGEE